MQEHDDRCRTGWFRVFNGRRLHVDWILGKPSIQFVLADGTMVFAETRQTTVCPPLIGVYRRCVRIGDVSIGLSARSANDIRFTKELDAFEAESPHCDIEIGIEWAERLQKSEGKRLFDSGALWTLYANDSGFIFDFATPLLGDQPYKRVCVDKVFSEARMFLNRECLSEIAPVYPLEYPLDELLVTNCLARGSGVEVHACGLVGSEIGSHLFLGHSGAGKSTTTRLWKSLPDVRILSDDRIILREHGNEIWMHGTPWHGEGWFSSPDKTKVKIEKPDTESADESAKDKDDDAKSGKAGGDNAAKSDDAKSGKSTPSAGNDAKAKPDQ